MPTLSSPAKLNLFLEVIGRRPDGFHDIESVFLEIDLADTLSAAPAETNAITLTCDNPAVPTGDGNLVVRAAELLRRECGVGAGIRFHLEKRIPMGGGLGGGSSNAAAALRLANNVWNTGLADADLAVLGARLGSDVPFFFYGGACLCQGRGEIITPLAPFPAAVPLGLAVTGIHSDTAAAYRGLRHLGTGDLRSAERFIRAINAGDAEAMAAAAFNRFEESVFMALPRLGEIHRHLETRLGRPVRMSGSGSGLWFLGGFDAMRVCPKINGTSSQEKRLLEKNRANPGVAGILGQSLTAHGPDAEEGKCGELDRECRLIRITAN